MKRGELTIFILVVVVWVNQTSQLVVVSFTDTGQPVDCAGEANGTIPYQRGSFERVSAISAFRGAGLHCLST